MGDWYYCDFLTSYSRCRVGVTLTETVSQDAAIDNMWRICLKVLILIVCKNYSPTTDWTEKDKGLYGKFETIKYAELGGAVLFVIIVWKFKQILIMLQKAIWCLESLTSEWCTVLVCTRKEFCLVWWSTYKFYPCQLLKEWELYCSTKCTCFLGMDHTHFSQFTQSYLLHFCSTDLGWYGRF